MAILRSNNELGCTALTTCTSLRLWLCIQKLRNVWNGRLVVMISSCRDTCKYLYILVASFVDCAIRCRLESLTKLGVFCTLGCKLSGHFGQLYRWSIYSCQPIGCVHLLYQNVNYLVVVTFIKPFWTPTAVSIVDTGRDKSWLYSTKLIISIR